MLHYFAGGYSTNDEWRGLIYRNSVEMILRAAAAENKLGLRVMRWNGASYISYLSRRIVAFATKNRPRAALDVNVDVVAAKLNASGRLLQYEWCLTSGFQRYVLV